MGAACCNKSPIAADQLETLEQVAVSRQSPIEGPQCIYNAFCESPLLCKTQKYCQSPDEITNEWLSGALNAPVVSFEKNLCTQGQLGLTVVLKNIQYSAGTTNRPSSVALKMHTQVEAILPIIGLLNCYSKELYYYQSFNNQVPMKGPKYLAAFTDANGTDLAAGSSKAVLGFNLIMEDLTAEYVDYNTSDKLPNAKQFEAIVMNVQPMHIKFWKHARITQGPFSDAGTTFDFYEKYRGMRSMLPQVWPMVRDAMPALAGWGTTWPAEFKPMIDMIDRIDTNPDVDKAFIGMMERVHRSRPKTLCHGDLNAGNVWVRKTNRDEILMTDWQCLGMAPIGFDFGLMLIVLPKGPTFQEKSAMMKNYHDKLPQNIRNDYPLSHLEDDFRCQIAFYMTNVILVMAGQLDPAVMDKEKFEFTWKTYWSGMYRRFLQFYQDEKIEDLCNQLINGTYSNFVE
jgi:thiamine kinase-like enzyme